MSLEKQITSFLKKSFQTSGLRYFQYSNRKSIEKMGGCDMVIADIISEYYPDKIEGFVKIKKIFSLETAKLIYQVNDDIYVTFELQEAENVDWLKKARAIKVGIIYHDLHIKIYQFIFGFAIDSSYRKLSSQKTFEKALKKGDIHWSVEGYKGVNDILSKVNFRDNLVDGNYPSVPVNQLFSSAKFFNHNKVVSLFLDSNGKLYVNSLFQNIFENFQSKSGVFDISTLEIKSLEISVEMSIQKNFVLPMTIIDIDITFDLDESHRRFIVDNKSLFFFIKGLDFSSNIYQIMKAEYLVDLVNKDCIVTYNDGKKKAMLFTHLLTYRNIIDAYKKIDNGAALKYIECHELMDNEFTSLSNSVGPLIGDKDCFPGFDNMEPKKPKRQAKKTSIAGEEGLL